MLIDFDFNKYWQRDDRFGPTAGFCLANHRPGVERFLYVVIPKNASSFVTDGLRNMGWSSAYYQEIYKPNRNQKVLVILRDPYQRWISGMVQYLSMYHGDTIKSITKDIFELLVDKVVFDDHTELQSYYLNGIDTNDCVFLNAKDNIRGWLNKTLIEKFSENNTPFIDIGLLNNSQLDYSHKFFKEELLKNLNNNISAVEKIKSYYKKDYDLINSIQYEN
jgi:nicotinamide riboside kinase